MIILVDEKVRKILVKAKRDPVFFIEHFCYDKSGKPYTLEPHQKLFLRDRSPSKLLMCSRRSGKTLSMITEMLYLSFFNKNYYCLLVAPTRDQASEFASVFNDIVLRSPMLQSSFIIDNKLTKQLQNGSRIKFASSGSKSGETQNSSLVGSGVDALFLDELQSMNKESLEVILPVVTGQTNQPHLVFSGTPRTRRDYFFEQVENAKTITEVYENNGLPKTCPNNGQFSLHRFKITDLDENGDVAFSRAEYRLTIDELELIKSTIGEAMFRREFCLELVEELNAPYYEELRKMAGISKKPTEFASPNYVVGGIDLGKKRNNAVLSLAELNPLQNWEIKYYKVFPLGTKYQSIIHYLINVLPSHFPNILQLMYDKSGVGEAVGEGIEEEAPYNAEGVIFSQPKKLSLVENAVSLLESRTVTYYPDEVLENEMSGYTREITESGNVVYKKNPSDDFIDSFNLTCLGISKVIQNGGIRATPYTSYSLGTNVFNKNYRQKTRNRWSNYKNRR